MHPVICKIGPLTIFSYGLMLAMAFLIASTLASLQAKRQGIKYDIILNFSFIVFISGIIGARLFYIVMNLGYYLNNPLEIPMLQYGGLVWYGGLFMGTLAGVSYLKKNNLPVYKVADLFVPFLALGQAIGRIGCFLNGCCFGKISEHYGLYSEAQKLLLVPTQIYSSLLLILIFIVLRFMQDRPHKDGEIFYAYLLFYSTKRFFVEFWRGDTAPTFGVLTLFQVICIVIFSFAFLKFFGIKRGK
jgi:phosphatidylglycerol---prolipoprotein diacylglyceryl transferase